MKIRYKVISNTAIIFLLLLIAFIFIFYTNMGLRFTLDMASKFIPGKLIAKGVQGNLAEQITIEDLSYQNHQLKITAHNIQLTWQPFYLLQKRLVINQLLAKDITLNQFKFSKLSCGLITTGKRVDAINLQLQAPNANLQIKGQLQEQYDFNWQMNIKKLSDFIPNFDGTLTAKGHIYGAKFNPKMLADFTIKQLRTPQDRLDKLDLRGKLQTELNTKGLSVNLNVIPDQQVPIKAQVFVTKHKKLQGQLTWRTSKLQFVHMFVPYIERLRGNLNVNFKLTGTLKDPEILGQASLRDATAYVPLLNLDLKNINLLASGNLSEIDYQGQMYSDKGFLKINGKTKLDQQDYPSEININGQNFLLCNTAVINIYISPDVKLSLVDERLDINGAITIPKAKIAPHSFRGTVTLPADVVFVEKEAPPTMLAVYSDIKLTLGEQVYLDAMGLAGRLSGQLEVQDQPKQTTIAYGSLMIHDGSYDIYGNKLTLEQGELIFAGPIDNPKINIKAIRKFRTTDIEDLTVGAYITGTLDRPKTDLFATPSGLSQEDILSYLILGQPISQVGQDNAALLLKAAGLLHPGGSNKITMLTDKLRQQFGFTEFGLGTQVTDINGEVTSGSAFVMGKNISPRLFISYSVGLLDPVNIFRARLKLTKAISLQSESSSVGTGLDLLYSIKKN
jgi:translocation and assembly module TamB